MQTVRKFNDNNPDILCHSKEHLSQILRLKFQFVRRISYTAKFRNTVYQKSYLFSKLFFDIILSNPSIFHYVKAKKAISKAFHYQMEGKGFTLVEVLSACPTNWGLSPIKAMEWLEENMIPYYPLGVKKDKGAE